MSFLLDTNVISEWVRPRPHAGVIRWMAEADEDRVFISVISIAEVRRGLERMAKGRRRDRIAAWLSEDLQVRFEGRILPVDVSVAQEWGVIVEKAGEARNGPWRDGWVSGGDCADAGTDIRHAKY